MRTESMSEINVHRLRLEPSPEDPSCLVPAAGAPTGLAPGLAERIGRLAEARTRRTGPVLTYSRLPDGSSVLCRFAAYRAPGDGFVDADVAVLPEGAARAGLTPINAWPEECWSARRGRLEPRGWIDRAELVRFAVDARGQLASVLADVRELFAEIAGPQLLLAGCTPHDVARWIKLICVSLPPAAARELTFTTSATSPYGAGEQIVGVPPEAEFAFSEVELRHLYRVRSAEGRCSPASTDPWAEIAARLWQHGRPELIVDTSRIPAGAPFDAGRLAAVALLEQLPIGREAELLAVGWISRSEHTDDLAQPDVDGLMSALTRIDRAAVGTGGPRPAALRLIIKAFRSLRRRATPEASDPVALNLGRAALRSALERCPTVGADPLAGLGLGPADRARLTAEFAPDVRAILDAADSAPAEVAGSLLLARTLGLDLRAGEEHECAANAWNG